MFEGAALKICPVFVITLFVELPIRKESRDESKVGRNMELNGPNKQLLSKIV
jgi:hypothetical protein